MSYLPGDSSPTTRPESSKPLRHIFHGFHVFDPVFDRPRSTLASKIHSGTRPLSPTFYKALEEAPGIARSTLFNWARHPQGASNFQFQSVWRDSKSNHTILSTHGRIVEQKECT
ncbi:hypothetical protein OBBRIDRAFT_832837 [Obba rivulosa]|uniref:Uncharacterized protein n=1 Tax=Obba rivulosa TaxID=1052685 RepID=A0A8E2DP61_9APHY|nr:hypothetical protein OBBRIDRAFT_832837 [Obba rivulosa]